MRGAVLLGVMLLVGACNDSTSVAYRAPAPPYQPPRAPMAAALETDNARPAPRTQASLVVLIIADTIDHVHFQNGGSSIAEGVKVNQRRMTSFFRQVAAATSMPLRIEQITGSASEDDPFNCENIDRQIQAIRANTDDTVVVYYAGHGFNIGPNRQDVIMQSIVVPEFLLNYPTRMPFLYCGSFKGNPNLDMIATWVGRQSPRLLIVMADSCNSFIPGTEPAPSNNVTRGTGLAIEPDLRLLSLFREARGTVLLAASEPGHFAFYTEDGGMFTNQFLRAIADLNPLERATWQALGAGFKPEVISFDGHAYREQPIYDIKIR
jgi:hypothetical protein